MTFLSNGLSAPATPTSVVHIRGRLEINVTNHVLTVFAALLSFGALDSLACHVAPSVDQVGGLVLLLLTVFEASPSDLVKPSGCYSNTTILLVHASRFRIGRAGTEAAGGPCCTRPYAAMRKYHRYKVHNSPAAAAAGIRMCTCLSQLYYPSLQSIAIIAWVVHPQGSITQVRSHSR